MISCLRLAMLATTFVLMSLLPAACSEPKPSISPEAVLDIDDLEALRWRNRILLVRAGQATEFARSLSATAPQAALEDRDLMVFVESAEGRWTAAAGSSLSRKLARDITRFLKDAALSDEDQVLLIGKDGGLKERYRTFDLEAISAHIDQMPMRRREMREKN
jgi:uncharacterized protein DUF4174